MDYEKIETCGKRIERALTIRCMRQAELCKLAKVPKSSMSLYLSGAHKPKQDRIHTMAKVLNVSEAWLVGYDVPMEREDVKNTDSIELTESERVMLDLFRKVPERVQWILINMIRGGLDTE